MAVLMIDSPWAVGLIVLVALVLFGGRLAGLGKSAGRAIKEFKQETSEILTPGDPHPASVVTERPASNLDQD